MVDLMLQHFQNWKIRLIGILILMTALFGLPACGTIQTGVPDLKRLYEVSANNLHQPPVVFVHGAFGSRLRDKVTQKEVWPGGLSNLLFSDFSEIALSIDPKSLLPIEGDLEAYALFDGIADRDYYGRIVTTLEDSGAYLPTRLGESPSGISRRLYLFIYDWRLDIVTNAARLGEFINQIQQDFNDPALKVDIVSHSMGALVTRYYLRYGRQDVLDSDEFTVTGQGAKNVRKVVMLGPPNFGSISGLQHIMMGYKVGFNAIPVEVLGTMPSAYQIMPHPDRDWMVDLYGKRFQRDLYEQQAWKDYQWGIFDEAVQQRIRDQFPSAEDAEHYLNVLDRYMEKNLLRGRRFHRAISAPYTDSRVRYIVFGGDCHLTPARCLVEKVGERHYIRTRPEEIFNPQPQVDYHRLMLEPGDGSVTKPSLLARNSLDTSSADQGEGSFPLAYSMFLCEEHSQLTGNISFQDNLLNVLLIQKGIEERTR